MTWLVEPLAGLTALNLLDDEELEMAKDCTGGATLNHCGCIFGLRTCNCNGGLVVSGIAA